MNAWIIGIITGLIAGIVSGFIVNYLNWWAEEKRWEKAKRQLIRQINISLNVTLSTIRTIMEIPPPKGITETEIIKYFEEEVLKTFDRNKHHIEYPNEKGIKKLFININSIKAQIMQLNTLLIGFKTAEPWYVELLFDMQSKLSVVGIPFMVIPEIYMDEHKNNPKFEGWRALAAKNIEELLSFIVMAKKDKRIQDYL